MKDGTSLWQRIGPDRRAVLISILLGSLLFALAAIYIGPNYEPAFLGVYHAELSNAPFDMDQPNWMRLRILAPLIGYLVHLRGPLFFLVPWTFLLLFIIRIQLLGHRLTGSWIHATLLASTVAFSCTTFIPLMAPGYVDTVAYFCVLFCFIPGVSLPLAALFMAFALSSHESALALLPAAILYRWMQKKELRTPLLFLGWLMVFMLPYVCYRAWANSSDPSTLQVSYYLTITNIRSQIRGFLPTLWGIFLAFRLYWIIPLAALVLSIRRKDHSQAILLVLIVAGAGSLLLVAYDTTRLMCMAFPAILLGSIQLIKTLPPMITLRSGALLFGMNFLITPAMVAAETFHLLRRTDRERTLLKEAQVLEQAPRSVTLLNISSTGKEPERRTVQVTG
ncbi:MAG: hypothetical protein IPO87_05645 [Flavobacteriales bacterium]|nr:hypothetical protein [Flavobacteriales bacterium]